MTAAVTDILPAVVARLQAAPTIEDGHGNALPFRFQDDGGGALPDAPTGFVYIEHENYGSGRGPAAYGGGQGANLYRNEGQLTLYVFTSKGEGIHTAVAESCAARLRSFRSDTMSCFSADVHPIGDGSSLKPPGLVSEVNNYSCAIVEVAMHFDQIG